MLVSERVGHFFFEGARLEYTEFGTGDRVVVLLHGQLMVRRMHEPLARRIAAAGYRVITLDLLGHGRSDRPDDAKRYSMTAFARQVVGLLDHLGVDQVVLGGTSLGAMSASRSPSSSPTGSGHGAGDAGARQCRRGGHLGVRAADLHRPGRRRGR